MGLQGVVSPARLQAAGKTGSALVYVAQVLGGSGGGKVMALALALSVVALTGTSIVLGARIIYGMASYRALPEFLGNVSRRFSTPVAASVVVGFLIIALTWVYLLTTTVQNAFGYVVDVTGLLFAVFYILTALATMAFYRTRVFSSARDAVTLGILPLAAAVFLAWMVIESLKNAGSSYRPEMLSLAGILGVGIILMLVARFGLKSTFFQIRREKDDGTVEAEMADA
jgi:amino acid transporter